MRKVHLGQTKSQNPGAVTAERHCRNLREPCPEMGTFGGAKIGGRGNPQWSRGRREGGKVIERINVTNLTVLGN